MIKDKYAILFLLAVALLLFAPDILSGRVILPLDILYHEGPFSAFVPAELQRVRNPHLTDLVLNCLPWMEMLRRSQEFLPLWNPYSFCGSPFLANAQTSILHPLSWIYLLLPTGLATSTIATGKMVFCGIFAFLFYRKLDFNHWACLLGAFAYMLSGHVIVWLGYPGSFPLVTLPFLFWALEKYLKTLNFSDLTWISLAYGLLFLGGQPQTGFIIALASWPYYLIRGFARPISRSRLVLHLVIAGALGFCLSAPQVLPFLEYLRESAAGHLRGHFGWKHYPWFTLISWIMPRFFGDGRQGNFWGFSSILGETFYIGIIPLLLAAIGAMRAKRDSFYWAIVAILLVGLLGLYAPLAQRLFCRIPLLANIDNNKLVVLVTFGLVSLAVAGMHQILALRSSRSGLSIYWIAAALFCTVFVIFGFLYLREPINRLHLESFEAREAAIFCAFLLATSVIVWLWRAEKLSSFHLASSLIALTMIDLLRLWMGYYPSFPSEYLRPRSTSVEFLQNNLGEDRFLGLAGFLPPETSVLFRLQDARGYDGLTPYRYYQILGRIDPSVHDLLGRLQARAPKGNEWTPSTLFYHSLERHLNAEDPEVRSALRRLDYWSSDIWRISRPHILSLLGIRYLLAPRSSPIPAGLGVRLVHSSDAEVWENLDVLPKAFISTRPIFFENDDAALEAISDPGFDFKKAAVICAGPQGATAFRQEAVGSELPELIPAQVTSYSPHRVELAAESKSGGWLILSDLFYPGWRASVDGDPVQIFPANYLFRAVKIPRGAHRVTFYYRPMSFYSGVALSIMALVVIAWILLKEINVLIWR